jgi:hypothetical protein
MKFSTDLYDLIQALTQAEKRYIKLFMQAFSSKGSDTQIELFDSLSKQTSYDEEQIRKQMSGKISGQNFHVSKNRLYQLILRGLYLFHSANSEQEKLNQKVFQSNLLRKKGLYKQSNELYDKALELARELDSFIHIPQLLSGQAKTWQQQRNIGEISNYVEKNLKEEQTALYNYNYELTFQHIEMRLLYVSHKNPTARSTAQLEVVKEIAAHPFLQDEAAARAVSKRALWYFRFLNGFIARYEGNYGKAADCWSHFVSDMEKDQKNLPAQIMEFISNLNNLMFLQLEAKRYPEAFETATKLENLLNSETVSQDLFLIMKIRERVIEFKLSWFLRTHQYSEGLGYWQNEVEKDWNLEWRSQVGDFRRLLIEYLAACLHISNGQSQQASDMIEQLWANKSFKDHDYLYASALITNLIIHFDLGNFQLLESLSLNTYRVLYKKQLLFGTEKLIFKNLRRCIQARNNKEMLQSFKALQNELSELQADKFEHILLDNLDLKMWIDSKIKKTSMAVLAQS